ncbi:hypothetical protein PENCOP_c012G05576 [Penicillium coprophilum]|uniref:Ketoreductase (KR) domain-containing protein n=1 Tax=Penicillium coprophilum TaxID=36646 RepID=A0A1V6UCB0_9EURO|nr:hypothetical protein PENCOP_c012G05576 [Penicillium coprophilum]
MTPITTFPFDNVIGALSHIRSGRHIGKIVISLGDNDDVQISSSRSGIKDEASARTIRSCNFHGCAVIEAKGDVADFKVASELFRSGSPRIAGIVQGFMVLRDKPYETMTLDDYHTANRPKVQGTWNLHCAAELHTTPRCLASPCSPVPWASSATKAKQTKQPCRHELGLPSNTVNLGLIKDVGCAAKEGTELNAPLDKRIWTLINEGTLRKILPYSILQLPVLLFPLLIEGTGAENDPRFSYMFNSHADATGGVEASNSRDSVDQAIRAFRLMHKSGADIAALGKVGLEVISGHFVKTLRLDTEPEPARPLIAYWLDLLPAVERQNWIRIKLG